MSKCTDKSDAATTLSSSNNAAVDDMPNGIKKVTLDDNTDITPPCDFISSGEEDMNSEKKCTSCEQNLESLMELIPLLVSLLIAIWYRRKLIVI